MKRYLDELPSFLLTALVHAVTQLCADDMSSPRTSRFNDISMLFSVSAAQI